LNILEKIRAISGIDHTTKRFRWLQRDDLTKLSHPHAVSLLTKGHNYWLFLTSIRGSAYSVLINKRVKQGYPFPLMMIVNYRFEPSLYSDTLFEGELVKDKDGNSVLLLNDVIILRNETTKKMTLVEKYNKIYDILDREYVRDEIIEPCFIQVKKLFTTQNVKYILNYVDKLEYEVRGLIFHPINSSFPTFYWDDKNGELKKPEELTVDKLKEYSARIKKTLIFSIKRTTQPDVYELYINNHGSLVYYDIAHVPTLDTSRALKKWFKENAAEEMLTCECKYFDKFSKWGIEAIETDKEVSLLESIRI
jgi:hypothetical protein